jgi:hypothetical protein
MKQNRSALLAFLLLTMPQAARADCDRWEWKVHAWVHVYTSEECPSEPSKAPTQTVVVVEWWAPYQAPYTFDRWQDRYSRMRRLYDQNYDRKRRWKHERRRRPNERHR